MFTAAGFQQQEIVKDSLVLWLDGNDKTSYPGSGTIWRDLSQGGRNGTLVSGPAYNAANGGSITFDGVNDYMSVASLPSLSTRYSLSFWIQLISITAAETQIFMPGDDLASISITNSKIGSWNGSTYRQSATVMSTGVWFNFVMTCNGSSTIFYINNTLNTTFASTATFAAGTGYICSSRPVVTRFLNANIGSVIFYSRALTAGEIAQNYNAQRSRFGL